MSIELTTVSARRGRDEVLHDITATFSHPVTTVMGPNGAGKTTLLHVLAGLVPHTGTVLVDGAALAFPGALSQLGYAPQTIDWPGRLRVREVCELACYLREVPRDQVDASVAQALQRAGLDQVAEHRVSTLSGGQKRRLSLAQTLVHRPPLLLLDEPTSELDPLFCEAFAGTVHELAAEHRVVITTHSLDDVGLWPGDVALVAHGHLSMVPGAATMSADQRSSAVRAAFHATV